MFIVAIVQHVKIGDLSQSGMSFSGDEPEDTMNVDEIDHLPDGTEIGSEPRLNKAEERSLVRDSTASFAGTKYPFLQSYFGRLLLLIRLVGIIIPSRFCPFREFARGGRQEEHDRWKARRKRVKINQGHVGYDLLASLRAII
jgi:hypothetical protein